VATPRLSVADIQTKAKQLRRDIIESTTAAASGHPTSSLSATDIVAALYYGGMLKYDPKNPHWPQRDRFILSKGHAAPLLYAVMAEVGYFSRDLLPTLRQIGSVLEGHPNMRRLSGVEASTGSLGQGLSIGVGCSLAAKLDGYPTRTYVVTGDGEMAEGQVWEAVMAAEKFKLDNLVCIVDQNGYQQTGPTKEVLDLKPFAAKFEAFGWFAQEIDGHDVAQVVAALEKAAATKGRPSAIVARTIKGYPLQSMLASDPNHHGKPLTKDEAIKALALLA